MKTNTTNRGQKLSNGKIVGQVGGAKTITRVTYRWDGQPGVEAGWYAESYDEDGFRDDSQKVWFPVKVENFDRTEHADLEAALKAAFPGAEIVYQD